MGDQPTAADRKTRRHTSSEGAATSASARPHVFSRTSKRGSAEDYARIFGGSGRTGTTASTNCAGVAYRSSVQRSPPVRRRGSGACPDTRRSNRPCATTTSTHSVSPDSIPLSKLNPVEPPWYGPVCPVVGEGWHREVSPYPDQSVITIDRNAHLGSATLARRQDSQSDICQKSPDFLTDTEEPANNVPCSAKTSSPSRLVVIGLAARPASVLGAMSGIPLGLAIIAAGNPMKAWRAIHRNR